MNDIKLNKYIDHTKLGPSVLKEEIDKLISEAIKYDFKSVCVSPTWVKYAKEKLKNTDILVCTVVGFPHGTHTTKVKKYETKDALKNGADEIDMVINVSDLKNKKYDNVLDEIKTLKKVCGKKHVLKVIIEACLLTKEEIIIVSDLCVKAGADFVKTSTGYSKYGARLEDIITIKNTVKDKAFIKASGGVSSKEDALLFIKNGANRIGTSKGVLIMEGETDNANTSY